MAARSRLKKRTKKRSRARRPPARKRPTVARARRRYAARKKNPIGTAHTGEWATVGAIAGGGALAGLVEGMQDRGQLPDLPMDIEPSLVIGAALVAVPILMKAKGQAATWAALLGAGMLAAASKEYVSTMYAPAEVAMKTAAELAEY